MEEEEVRSLCTGCQIVGTLHEKERGRGLGNNMMVIGWAHDRSHQECNDSGSHDRVGVTWQCMGQWVTCLVSRKWWIIILTSSGVSSSHYHRCRLVHSAHHILSPVAIPTTPNTCTHTYQDESCDQHPAKEIAWVCGRCWSCALTKHTNKQNPVSRNRCIGSCLGSNSTGSHTYKHMLIQYNVVL